MRTMSRCSAVMERSSNRYLLNSPLLRLDELPGVSGLKLYMYLEENGPGRVMERSVSEGDLRTT